MFRNILSTLCGCLLCIYAFASDAVKPVTGTWLNLVWQDDRNNYMNPPGSDNFNPALWQAKVEELSEMGIDCLVIMQVANEGKAFYPSSTLPPAYDVSRKSPVDAIMEKASELGMKVFLSCGWARNQDDDLRDPFVIETQREIMLELTALYKDSPAFYGWYLPVESSFEPVLPEHAVEGVNSLSARARALTPDKMVMISPYGICHADMENPLFEERIAALDVDFIAYQDEVGCVREPMPLPRMKEHFRKLGEIHRRTGIAFWANIESFTWEKSETNSRQSALVPAAFGRYLAQMTAVSQAGVEKILSFAVAGIYDRQDTGYPLGQPELAKEAYDNYMAWKRGEGRWKLLEHVFTRDLSIIPVSTQNAAASALFDGLFAQERTDDPFWVVFPEGQMTVIADIGSVGKINCIAAKFLNYKKGNVSLPEQVRFSFSRDGKKFGRIVTVKPEAFKNDLHDCWSDIIVCEKPARARYLKVEAIAPEGSSLMCDEILVNPEYERHICPTVDLTLVPPGEISDKVDLDIRAGIVNRTCSTADFKVKVIASKGLFHKVLKKDKLTLDAGMSGTVKATLNTAGLKGEYKIALKVKSSEGRSRLVKVTKIVPSSQRSLAKIAGAFAGLYHWSELEGKHWNPDIKKLTADDWRNVVRSMHEVGMDIIVVQELFRNESYNGNHSIALGCYAGKAYYPSAFYPGRMDIACQDPLEAIMTQADSLGMQVFPGIGLFDWFDFSKESLQWHKLVAKEVWDRYGHHPSFYGFYVSEESGGSLNKWESEPSRSEFRKGEIIKFFREFGQYCHSLAPGKPVMLATNSFDVKGAEQTYQKLFDHLDILCPFGFARMPDGDVSGKEAADFLQTLCDRRKCHLWFDLEAFLFYPDGSLYPRDFEGIVNDLNLFGNFEKILCYQYPGVFCNPELHPRIGEDKAVILYERYGEYYKNH